MSNENLITADTLVWVRRHWQGTLGAAYRLGDIRNLHWTDISGGIKKRVNRLYVHGYVQCDGAVDGELQHSCQHGPPPHRIKVCIVAVSNGGSRSLLMRHLMMTATDNDRRRWPAR